MRLSVPQIDEEGPIGTDATPVLEPGVTRKAKQVHATEVHAQG